MANLGFPIDAQDAQDGYMLYLAKRTVYVKLVIVQK